MNFASRSEERELMDDPQISKDVLHAVLKDINKANSLLGGNRITINSIKKLIRENPRKTYSILDVGCGDGSMMRALAQFFRKLDISVRLVGWDISETALKLGRSHTSEFPEIEFHRMDVSKEPTKIEVFDFVISTLTLHHFSEAQIPNLMKMLLSRSRIAIVINDLQRSRIAYALFKGFSAIFIRTAIAKNDGLLSIKRGFTRKELIEHSKKIGGEHQIKWKWAYRYVWIVKA